MFSFPVCRGSLRRAKGGGGARKPNQSAALPCRFLLFEEDLTAAAQSHSDCFKCDGPKNKNSLLIVAANGGQALYCRNEKKTDTGGN